MTHIEHMKEWVKFLKARSDNGQHMQIPSELSAGACFDLAVELEKFIDATEESTQEYLAMPDFPKRETITFRRPKHMTEEDEAYLPLYTHPQPKREPQHKREWIGLTNEEVDECYESIMFNADIEPTRIGVYLEIEAKLKEKNHVN